MQVSMRHVISTGATALFSLLFLAAPAQAQRAADAKPPALKIDFRETTLKNGLRVVTVEDHQAPVVSLCLTYNVGSRDEQPGRTGFAHMFEHMMFKGSQNVSPAEQFNLVMNNGGQMDAMTAADRTLYFERLPANQLDLALFLESDRMRSLSITQENFDTERNVVQEERRLRIDNQPYGKSREALLSLMYDSFAYKHPGIGSMEDLRAASVQDLQGFFRTYYAPNNVVLVLVGDFKTAEAVAKIRKYFEDIPSQPAPPAPNLAEPEQQAERRATVTDALAPVPAVSIGFKAMPGNAPDYYALEVLSSILQSGQSSRLYQRLVKEKELVTNAGGFVDERTGASGLHVTAAVRPGKQVADVEAALFEEFERLRREPVSAAELEKAKSSITRALISGMGNSLLRAVAIGQYAAHYNDAGLINTRMDKLAAVTTEDVQRAAQKYLRPANRTILITLPKPAGEMKADAASGPAAPAPAAAAPAAARKVMPPVGKAPVSKEVLAVRLPKGRETALKNGLRVIVLEGYDQVPTFTLQMMVMSGGLADPADHRGLASFTASLLREGTRARTSREIAEQVESLGTTLAAESSVSAPVTTITASGLVQNFSPAMSLLADVIRNPQFPKEEVEKYKQRLASQLQLQRSTPPFLAQEQLSRAVYGHGHPAGFTSPPLEAVKKTTTEDLTRFHAAHYRPNNALLLVVGAVNFDQVVREAERAFGDWQRGDVPKAAALATGGALKARVHLIDRPGSVQTLLQLGALGITRTDADYFALLVMDKVVGGGPAARLFATLREAQGYTYGAYSQLNSSTFRGLWQASADVRTEVTDPALQDFLEELRRIREDAVPAAELDAAKQALTGSFALSLEQPNILLQNIVTQKLYLLPANYWDAYPQKVAAITAQDIQRVARKYLDPSTLQIVAVGDSSKIQRALAKHGTVEVSAAGARKAATNE